MKEHTITSAQTPCLSGSAHERACMIVQRCGGDPEAERRNGWQVCCPAHQDTSPSLRISAESDKVLLHCFAGCSTEAICAAISISMQDLFADDRPLHQDHARRLPRKTQPSAYRPDNVPLQFAVDFLIDDPSMLDVEGIRDVLRAAMQVPTEKLWVERELGRHGINAQTVWQAVQPQQQKAAPRIVTRRDVSR